MARAYDDDDEGPSEHDAHLIDDEDSDAIEDTVPCPACGKEVLAFAEHCHHCGEYFAGEAWMAQRSAKQGLWTLVGVLVAAAMLFGAAGYAILG